MGSQAKVKEFTLTEFSAPHWGLLPLGESTAPATETDCS